jgi:hypothetical protein
VDSVVPNSVGASIFLESGWRVYLQHETVSAGHDNRFIFYPVKTSFTVCVAVIDSCVVENNWKQQAKLFSRHSAGGVKYACAQ